MTEDEERRMAQIGRQLASEQIEQRIDKARAVTIGTGAVEEFNRELIKSGLAPDAIGDLAETDVAKTVSPETRPV